MSECRSEEASSLSDKAPVVLRAFFDHSPTFLTDHHISTYEATIFREIPDIIRSENPIVVLKEPLDAERGIYKYKTEIFVGGADGQAIDVGPPIITVDGGKTVRRMFPNEARLRNLTYASQFRADILIRLTFTTIKPDGEVATSVRELGAEGFPLFKLPVLLRSRLCSTHGAGETMMREMGECPADQGGYFIIDGAEKVLITRQEQAFNTVFVFKKPASDLKISTHATVKCQHPTTKRMSEVSLYRLHEVRGSIEQDAIRISIPFVKGAVPLFVIFRALGVESDEEIVRMIVPKGDASTLIPSIHDAWPITTKPLAIEFLRTLTSGFITANVLDILNTHLFSHVPNRPLAKAQYLAEIVRKMIRVETGQEPPTNRDDIRNQRIMPAGILLRGLFSNVWKVWKKGVISAIDSQYNYNRSNYQDENFLELFVPANLPKTLATGVLNTALMRGFRGRWGTDQYNTKSGVLQPLARISYLDAASHTRRVVSDFDTSLKLVGPRQLHTSQVGYFCTSETPTGAHIGATKNLSILTAVSCNIPAEPVVEWLFARGGVLEVAATPRWLLESATSVQVNGGTIGFTQHAGELVQVLKLMKWTGCLSPMASISFNTADNVIRIYLDDGRPLRPLWHLSAGGAWPAAAAAADNAWTWRNLVLGTLPLTAALGPTSTEFVDPLANTESATLADYSKALAPFVGAVEYVDPYEGNESYIDWWGRKDVLTAEHTHVEIHPSTLMGVLASMIPFANHNQSPRNQLSCSQSKQAIGYYASNYENRFDTYGSMLCYGEGALCRTLVHDAVAGGAMPYGTNLIFAFNSFDGYNQDDGILFNRSSIERGLFRSLAFRSYESVEEEDEISGAVYRIGNPKFVLAWTDLRPGNDYTQLDDQGIIREGSVIDDKTVLVGRYMTIPETGKVVDASVLPTVFTKGRVDKVVVLHQANGLRLVKVRILEERVPELGDKFCLDDSHDVLTAERGWVPIADVSVADRVAQLNRETGELEYVHPLETLVFDHEGDMYEVETQGVSQRVTLNHRMWVQPRNATGFEFVEARHLTGDVRFLSYDQGQGANKMEIVDCSVNADNIQHDFRGQVYCLRVPSEVFLVRRNGRCSFTGNSTRHGQKGTMGMMIDAADMPRTADGMVPDVMVNPHCIPSRMTMAQMLEQVFGKLGAIVGAKVNATPFMNDSQSLEAVGDALEMLGLQRTGEEIMYAGTTGQMFKSSVFIGPLNFMRLKHLTQDKLNARGAGRKEMRTHQPTGGRGNEGGMRIGEMERDVLIAHGITDFLTESMMRRSDGTEFWVCNGCGTIPIVSEAEGMFVCALCDGPLTYQGVSADTISLVLPVRKSRATFSKVAIPYAAKLLDQELTTYMNAGFRFLTGVRAFREPTDPRVVLAGNKATEVAEVAEVAEETNGLLEGMLDALAGDVASESQTTKEAAIDKKMQEIAQGVAPKAAPVQQQPVAMAIVMTGEEVAAPEDIEDEGQPEKNEGEEAVAPPPGETSVDFDAKQNKEFTTYFPVRIELDGKTWPSVEHYFQAAKFPSNPEYQDTIRQAKTPALAKKLGKTRDVPLRPDWTTVRETVMMKALRAKFEQPELKQKLLDTGSMLLRNMSPQDNFWGVGRSGKGQNKLGKLLMHLRRELAAPAAAPDAAPAPVAAPAAAVAAAQEPVIEIDTSMPELSEMPETPVEPRTDIVAGDGSNISGWNPSDNIKVIKY